MFFVFFYNIFSNRAQKLRISHKIFFQSFVVFRNVKKNSRNFVSTPMKNVKKKTGCNFPYVCKNFQCPIEQILSKNLFYKLFTSITVPDLKLSHFLFEKGVTIWENILFLDLFSSPKFWLRIILTFSVL